MHTVARAAPVCSCLIPFISPLWALACKICTASSCANYSIHSSRRQSCQMWPPAFTLKAFTESCFSSVWDPCIICQQQLLVQAHTRLDADIACSFPTRLQSFLASCSSIVVHSQNCVPLSIALPRDFINARFSRSVLRWGCAYMATNVQRPESLI